ncbi:carbohydrate binding domain-containing protein [Candidatus Woesearchaeota archaeon]|nr:carbohydrate binding domain-containing protein [Candidatus Woesearchaeota archaeon]
MNKKIINYIGLLLLVISLFFLNTISVSAITGACPGGCSCFDENTCTDYSERFPGDGYDCQEGYAGSDCNPGYICQGGSCFLPCNDGDGDTFQGLTPAGCSPTTLLDCDDGNAAIKPGATEVCDGVDNDCANGVDDGGVCSYTFFCDSDSDGVRSESVSGTCDSYGCVPGGCSETQGTDCDDDNAATKPGAVEVCDGLDNDCDGFVVDEIFCDSISTCDQCVDSSDCDSQETCIGGQCVISGKTKLRSYYYDACGSESPGNTYDNSMGRLFMVDDSSGTTFLFYDKKGRILSEMKSDNAVNLLVNPGFGTGGDILFYSSSDSYGDYSITTEEAHSGTYSLKMVDRVEYQINVPGRFFVPGETYTYSLWAKVVPGIIGDDLRVSHGLMSYTDCGSETFSGHGPNPASSAWQRITETFTVNPACTPDYLALHVGYTNVANPISGTRYVDDIQIERGTTATRFVENTFLTSYIYDKSGNIKEMIDPAGRVINYDYDLLSRLKSFSVDGVSTNPQNLVEYDYGPFSAIDEIRFGLSDQQISFDYNYYPSGRIQDVSSKDSSSNIIPELLNEQYTYDIEGNALTVAMTGMNFGLEYDPLDRLTSVTDSNYFGNSISYTYDRIGNMLSRIEGGLTRSYNYEYGTNKLLTITSDSETYTYFYDPRGFISKEQLITDGQTLETLYDYNEEGQLVKVTKPNLAEIHYVYDYKGSRTRRNDVVYIFDQIGNLIFEGSTVFRRCYHQDFTESGRNFVIKYDGETVASLDVNSILALKGDAINNTQINPNNFVAFDIRTSSGDVVASITKNGDLYVQNIFESDNVESTPGKDFLVKQDSNALMLITETGDLFVNCILPNHAFS